MYPKNGTFFVAQFAFDQPNVGTCYDVGGHKVFGVFSYDKPDDEAPFCDFAGSRFQCNLRARAWNDAMARGEVIKDLRIVGSAWG
jgi:hypothetical protein